MINSQAMLRLPFPCISGTTYISLFSFWWIQVLKSHHHMCRQLSLSFIFFFDSLISIFLSFFRHWHWFSLRPMMSGSVLLSVLMKRMLRCLFPSVRTLHWTRATRWQHIHWRSSTDCWLSQMSSSRHSTPSLLRFVYVCVCSCKYVRMYIDVCMYVWMSWSSS